MSHHVCVFCGSRSGADPAHARAARALGAELAGRRATLVYGGGSRGMMGAVADAALAGGARVVGVVPRGLFAREAVHTGISEIVTVDSLLARKARMAELSDAFVSLPGGIGTLDELFEMWTWSQLGIHAKRCGILDVNGYFEELLGFLDRLVEHGYLSADQRAIPRVDDSPARLLTALLG